MAMKKYVLELELYVDEDALKAHDGDATPPPNDVEEWDASDVFEAARLGIIEPRDGSLNRIREATEE